MARAVAAIAIAGALAGCGDGTAIDGGRVDRTGPPCGTGGGTVEIGEGGATLRPLSSTGDELEIVLGPQGGIHVLVGFFARSIDLEMTVRYRLVEVSTLEPVGTETSLRLDPGLFTTQDGETIRNPDLLVLNGEAANVETFANRIVRAEVEALTPIGKTCDAREVTLRAPR